VLLLSCVGGLGSRAQDSQGDATPRASNLHQWGAVTLFHGLPSDRVRAVAQDAEGAMWFGTDGGLARYDGRRTQTVSIEGLGTARVLALKSDGGGALWVGTAAGAAVLKDGVWRVVGETRGQAVNSIITPERGRAVMAGGEGRLFDCALYGDGTMSVHAFPEEPLKSADAGPPGALELASVAAGRDGVLYVGSRSRGLLAFADGRFREVLSRPRPFFVEALEADARGALWMGARAYGTDGGLYLSERVEQPRRVGAGLGTVNALARDAAGDLWVGTDGQGALRVRDAQAIERLTFKGTAGGLRSDRVYAIFEDRAGVVWFGTDRGVCRYDPLAPRNEEVSTEPAGNFVRAVFRTRAGELLAGTNSGLFVFDERRAVWHPVAEFARKTVHAIAEDAAGRLLVGTPEGLYAGVSVRGGTGDAEARAGVDERRPEEGEGAAPGEKGGAAPDEQERSGVESVRAIRVFRGATYVATYGRGVERVEGGRRTLIFPADGADARLREVTGLHADSDARLWIGTARAGAFVFDGGQSYPAAGAGFDQLRQGAVWSFDGTPERGLWVGTAAGLFFYRTGQSLAPAIADVDARAVVAGDESASNATDPASDERAGDSGDSTPPSAWCATAGGGLLRVRLDPELGPLVSRLDVEQGLASSWAFALLRLRPDTRGGAPGETLLVGTTRGLTRYAPGAARPTLTPARVMSRRLHNTSELAAGIELPYPQNSLALDVAALDTRTFPEQFRYAFVLRRAPDGAEVRRKLGADAQFLMENLPPGRYSVEARAFTKDLVASAPLRFEFAVARAPFPRTIVLLGSLLALALLALLWGAWQNRKMARATRELAEAHHELAGARLNLANEAERERRRIARDLHDQTLADLRSLMLLTDRLPAPGANGHGERVEPAAFRAEIESISTEVRRICEDLSPSALDNVGLAAALEWALSNAVAHCPAPERFDYEFAADEDLDERLSLAPGVRMQIYRIAQEAITNVCRHASARRVRLSVTLTPAGDLLLALEDDGRGNFDPRERKSRRGRGLSSIRDRASLIEAEVAWDALPAGGTRFTLSKSGAAKSEPAT
jgi:signal transduction histidine kinase/ligand-binding sensor domain-containing protein